MAMGSFDAMRSVLFLLVVLVGVAACDKATVPSASSSLPPWMAELHRSAQNGDAEAQYLLGSAFLGWRSDSQDQQAQRVQQEKSPPGKFVDPDGLPIDETKAAYWLERAAAQGHVRAQRNLGQLYLPNPFDQFDLDANRSEKTFRDSDFPPPKGFVLDSEPKERVKRDAKTAIAWFAKAAASGDAESQLQLGIIYATGNGVGASRDEAMVWYRKAAEQGNRYAQFNLGEQMLQPTPSTEAAKEGVAWLEKAAAQGLAAASHYLGWAYSAGVGVSTDWVIACKYYLKAAEQGYVQAMPAVGRCYYYGSGVAKDFKAASFWLHKAADAGDADGQNQLAILYLTGNGVPKDKRRALELFELAAAQSHTNAQYALGGFLDDRVLQYAWLNLAAASGDSASANLRDNVLSKYMSAAELAEAQRLSSSWKKGIVLVREGTQPRAVAAVEQSESPPALQKKGSGTLFVVTKDGYAVTNNHVVAGCAEIRLNGGSGVPTLVNADSVNDLALLKLPEGSEAIAQIASEPNKLRQGEDIVVFGFPLNAVLSSGGNMTPGVVSALTGLGNNTNQIQITAPVQPGSSGSPVLNRKGEVVAVVSQKLSDAVMAKATGQIGQNVNFAVNGQTLRSFLEANRVKYKSGAGFFAGEKSTADLADAARQWTRVVECWK